VLARLEENAPALKSLAEMEASGGEPDVVGKDKDRYVFCDCSAEKSEWPQECLLRPGGARVP
jgi:hypothetical protein